MEIIALILIIVLVSLTGTKKGNRARQAAQNPNLAQGMQNSKLGQAIKAADAARAAQAAKQAKTAKPAVQAAQEAKLKNLRFVPLAVPAEGNPMLDDDDCHGGSMAHTHTEGVSRTEQARRMAAIDESRTADVLPERIDAQALRRAVVMAEVLGRPRALQRRRA